MRLSFAYVAELHSLMHDMANLAIAQATSHIDYRLVTG